MFPPQGRDANHKEDFTMAVKVAINGFGRIGRLAFRQMFGAEGYEVVAINDLFDAETNFHLLEYDTNYGRANLDAVVEGDNATVGDWKIHCFAERDPKLLTWGAYGVDVVVESTGIFRSAKQAHVHIENGAKKVIMCMPRDWNAGALRPVLSGVVDCHVPCSLFQLHPDATLFATREALVAPVPKIRVYNK